METVGRREVGGQVFQVRQQRLAKRHVARREFLGAGDFLDSSEDRFPGIGVIVGFLEFVLDLVENLVQSPGRVPLPAGLLDLLDPLLELLGIGRVVDFHVPGNKDRLLFGGLKQPAVDAHLAIIFKRGSGGTHRRLDRSQHVQRLR